MFELSMLRDKHFRLPDGFLSVDDLKCKIITALKNIEKDNAVENKAMMLRRSTYKHQN